MENKYFFLQFFIVVMIPAIGVNQNLSFQNFQAANSSYDAPEVFPSNGVADDFGPRRVPSTNFHLGIDYNSSMDDGNNDKWDLILAPFSGVTVDVNRLWTTAYSYKQLCYQPYLEDYRLIFGHVYDNTAKTYSINSETIGLVGMSGNLNANKWAQIFIVNGETIALGQVDGLATYNGVEYEVSNQVTAGEPLVPLGNSSTTGAHLHLNTIPEVETSSTGTSFYNSNPLQFIDYPKASYNLTLYSQHNANAFQPLYSATGQSISTLALKCEMETTIGGSGNNRYQNIFDVDRVRFLIKKVEENDFELIIGSGNVSEISLGGIVGQNIINHPNPNFGNWTTTGVDSRAYNNGYPNQAYDIFHYSDFITRIHLNDPMDGGNAVLATCPDEARYDDGSYAIKARVTDIRGGFSDTDEQVFTLDNFQPYIASFTFNAVGLTQYTRSWICGSCGISLSPNPVGMEVSQQDWNAWLQDPTLMLNIQASEPLGNLTLDLVVGGTVLAEEIAGTSFPNSTDWVFDLSAYADQLTGQVDFRFSGYDTNNNALLAFTPSQQTSCVTVPTRIRTSGPFVWTNPSGIQSGQDNVYSVCIDCGGGGRSVMSDCAVIAIVPDSHTNCLDVEADITNATSSVASDGSIDLTVMNGTPPYEFVWSNGSMLEDLTALAPGTYSITVFDALCCSFEGEFEVTSCDRYAVYISGDIVEATGGATGAIDVTLIDVTTGTPIPSNFIYYQWTGPNGYTSNAEDISNLSPGNYCLEVRENSTECLVASRCFSVCGPMILGIQHFGYIECEGELGKFNVTIWEQNVTPPYTIQWSNGATTALNENLLPGTYCVTVTDANGCSDYLCAQMYVQYPIEIDAQVESAGCNNPNGSINISASSTKSEITSYLWSTGASTEDVSGLTPGEYCVTVTNAAGCEEVACFNVGNTELMITVENVTNPYLCTEPPCSEGYECTADGAININVQTNVPGVSYQWSGPHGFTSTNQDITGLLPGDYTVTVTAGHCTMTKEFTLYSCFEEVDAGSGYGCITFQNSFNFSFFNAEVNPIENSCDGSIELNNGSSGFNFIWSGPNGFMSSENNIYNLCEGTYCVTVTNGCGGNQNECFEIVDCNTQSLAVNGFTNNACPGYNVGNVIISVSGGAAPYRYSWNNGAISSGLYNVSPGNYCVTVTDANGCQANNCFLVGTESTTNEWIECTYVTWCDGNVVETDEYPEIEIPHPTDCRKVRVICSGNGIPLYDYTPIPEYQITGSCVIAEINPVTGQICDYHYGYYDYYIDSYCNGNGSSCPTDVYCVYVAQCIFPTLNLYYIDYTENWLQVGVVGIPPVCFRQFYCRFSNEPLCQCQVPCDGDFLVNEGGDAIRDEFGNINFRQSALWGQDLSDETYLNQVYNDVVQRASLRYPEMRALPNPDFEVIDAAMDIEHRESELLLLDQTFAMQAYPNPGNGALTVEVVNPNEDQLGLMIYDAFGNILFNQKFMANKGSNMWLLEETTKFPAGIYLLVVKKGNGEQVSEKLIRY